MAHSNFPQRSSATSSGSASTSYAHDTHYVYDVFVNHRGPDCKETFATDLHKRLSSYGLRVFLDEQELQRGENLTSQIKGAIREASVHIAVFSKNYAESKWCLEELELMLESKKIILPVFYDGINPSDLRRTRGEHGVYAQALQKLEKKKTVGTETHPETPRYSPDKINKWRQALSDAADISGFELAKYKG